VLRRHRGREQGLELQGFETGDRVEGFWGLEFRVGGTWHRRRHHRPADSVAAAVVGFGRGALARACGNL
jgi:hypothetical protein